MIESNYRSIDTPALLIDRDRMIENIDCMVEKARAGQVKLRPHIKTHRMPELAKLCLDKGATGITVAKIGEAEVMAEHGITDIFIANEVIGQTKYERLKKLQKKIKLSVGIDGTEQIDQIEQVFANAEKPLDVLIEIEVGENRSGLITDEQIKFIGRYLLDKKNIRLIGVFSHEGHCYKAKSIVDCKEKARIAHLRTIEAGQILREQGHDIQTISVGSTPSMLNATIADGVTEIRPGTFIFMDVGQGSILENFSHCAATVLASVISRPTEERIVVDAGAKALTSQNRTEGICATYGYGLIKGSANIRLRNVFDEHGVILNKVFRESVCVGDKIEIIPNHICPTCNLYEKAYLVSKGEILKTIPVLGRGKSQ